MFTKKLALVLCVGAVVLLATAGANATVSTFIDYEDLAGMTSPSATGSIDHIQAEIITGNALFGGDATQVSMFGKMYLPNFGVSGMNDSSYFSRTEGNWTGTATGNYLGGNWVILDSSVKAAPENGVHVAFQLATLDGSRTGGNWTAVIQWWDSNGGPGGTPVLRDSMTITGDVTGTHS